MAAEWYYTTNKQQMGPVSWEELRQLASSGLLKPNDLVWADGMPEWVKANRQDGLFPKTEGGTATASGQAPAADEDEPPPPRKSERRKQIDAELEESDRDDRRRRRRTSAGMSPGLKITLIVGGILAALMVVGCGGLAVIWIVVGSLGGGGGGGGGVVLGGGTTYDVNLMPNFHHDRVISFRAGQPVNITVTTNRVPGPFQPDVDLFVLHRGMIIAQDVRISPDCNVAFVAPANDSYIVRVQNLGPNVARSRVVVR